MGKVLKGISIQDVLNRTETMSELPSGDKYWYDNFQIYY